jgi:hypothetical protein
LGPERAPGCRLLGGSGFALTFHAALVEAHCQIRARAGAPVKPLYIARMCGRSTYKLTWEEIVAPYRLTLDSPPHNFEPRYNVCPTDPIDTIVAQNGKRNLIPMR